jgi:hypothetical protein
MVTRKLNAECVQQDFLRILYRRVTSQRSARIAWVGLNCKKVRIGGGGGS